MSDMRMVKSVEVLAAEINAIKDQTRAVVLTGAIEIGQRLVEAKALVAFGQWGTWLASNVDYSERTAQNLMRVYEEYGKNQDPQALADLSYTKAVAMLGLPKELRDELMEDVDVEALSSRELQEEIQRLREENQKKQVTIDDLMAASDEEQSPELEQLRAEAEKAKAEANQAEADLKKANEALAVAKTDVKELEAAKRREKDAKERADRADALVVQFQEKIKEVESKTETVIEEKIIEVVPADVAAELEKLRGIAAKAPSAEVVRLRAGYDRMVAEFKATMELLRAVQEVSPEDGDKYRRALYTATKTMSDALKGENADE